MRQHFLYGNICLQTILRKLFKCGQRAPYHVLRGAVGNADIALNAELIRRNKQQLVPLCKLAEFRGVAVRRLDEQIERAFGSYALQAVLSQRAVEQITVSVIGGDIRLFIIAAGDHILHKARRADIAERAARAEYRGKDLVMRAHTRRDEDIADTLAGQGE